MIRLLLFHSSHDCFLQYIFVLYCTLSRGIRKVEFGHHFLSHFLYELTLADATDAPSSGRRQSDTSVGGVWTRSRASRRPPPSHCPRGSRRRPLRESRGKLFRSTSKRDQHNGIYLGQEQDDFLVQLFPGTLKYSSETCK